MMPDDARTPFGGLHATPHYAVIFSSLRSAGDDAGYAAMAERMLELAARQPGYLGVESARGADGFGITVSYWATLEDIARWKAHAEHRIAQETGRARWYEHYELRVAQVLRGYAR
jgi:heme-degrading monooxygenase HmoA